MKLIQPSENFKFKGEFLHLHSCVITLDLCLCYITVIKISLSLSRIGIPMRYEKSKVEWIQNIHGNSHAPLEKQGGA